MYELDGLKVGGGIEGAGFTNGGGAGEAGFVLGMLGVGLAPAACVGSIATHAPKKATPAARKNVASAVRSNLLICIAISLEPI